MKNRALRAVNNDRGMSTAEYAVGTVGAAGFAGLLCKLLTSDEVQSALWGLLQHAFSIFN